MTTIELPTLAEPVRTLPAEGAHDRRLQRLVDLQASAEAAAALQASSRGVGILVSAAAVLADENDAAARNRLHDAVLSPEFESLLPQWIRALREVASSRPDSGACTVASALELWSWTMSHFGAGEGPAVDELAEVLCHLLAARALALDVAAKDDAGLRSDLSHVYAAHASASAGAACAELVFGYRRHLVWDAEGCATCYAGDELDDLEALMPGIASGARMSSDVIEADGSHAAKAGPCIRLEGVDTFMRLRNKLDGCLTGARLAKDRAAAAIASAGRA